jgi:hypothetical protein
MRAAIAALAAVFLGSCSTVMEYNRPEATNLKQFYVGEKRIDVISNIGSPTTSVKDGDNSCDVYSLYTSGVSRAGKAGIILVEGAADFFTLGLTEVIATPAEAASKSKRHTVMLCYSASETLSEVRNNGKTVAGNIGLPPDRSGESPLAPATAPAPAPAVISTAKPTS